MGIVLGLTLVSFLTVSVLLVPFINFLYRIKFQRQSQKTVDVFETRTPIFDKLHGHKAGTPIGGGLLIVTVVSFLFVLALLLIQFAFGVPLQSVYPLDDEIFIILFTFISFGLLGLYDDLRKTFGFERKKFWGLRLKQKFFLQWVLALFIGWFLYQRLGIDIINVTFFDVYNIGILFIPFSSFVIVSFANAVNITDGLDGLATGLLLICLLVFLVIAQGFLDIPASIFIGLWIGAIIAFLYFNVWPARVWLGDVGALSFGATLAVIGLLLGKVIALAIIGGVFVIEVSSSLLQILAKKFLKRKLFEVSPLHLWLQNRGWEEPKIVARFWLAGAMLAIFGLWLAFF